MKKLIFLILVFAGVAAQAKVYNVRDFGAAGDGVQIDSPAVNEAIDAAFTDGGGVVYFPDGVYSCYSIRLKDDITLRLADGAVIKAAAPTAEQGYDLPEPNEWDAYQDFGHSHWKNSLIWGMELENITIEGRGLIDGTGVLSRGVPRKGSFAEANKAIALKNCRNVKIKDIRMLQCGHFAMLLTGVDWLEIDGVLVDTNRDALDIDCCANVKITDCVVNTLNDDAIVLKSSYGLAFETVDGGLIENISVKGIVMDDIWNSPIYIRVGDRMRGPEGLPASAARNIEISDVRVTNCDSRYALLIVGLPDSPVENVSLKNISIQYKGGLTKDDVREQRGSNPFFFGRNNGYPEPSAHGIQPAWGLSMQHARNISFKNVEMELMQPDEREKIYLKDVENFSWE